MAKKKRSSSTSASAGRKGDAGRDGGSRRREALSELHLSKQARVRLTAETLSPGGEAVCRTAGIPVFVSRAVPGDVLDVDIFDVRKSFARGKIAGIVESSAKRVEPPCKLFKVCGGCQWQHIAYEHQLEAKRDIVRQALKHLGGLPGELVLPCLPAAQELFYRNKAQFPVAHPHGSRRILAGYYREGSHQLVNIKHCPVQPEPMDRLLSRCKELLEQHRISAYNEKEHGGLVRHIVIRFSFAESRLLLTLVLNASIKQQEAMAQRLRPLSEELMAQVPELAGVCLNFNPARGNRILGADVVLLSGSDRLVEELRSRLVDAPDVLKRGLRFKLSPLSFFQVNTRQAELLLDLVLDMVRQLPAPGSVVDAYSGVGTIAHWLSPACSRVIAIEEVVCAVEDGRQNARLNRLENIEFLQGRVEDVLPRLVAGGTELDVVVLDPPRKGVGGQALQAVIESRARCLIYVSCNPATLARDLRILGQGGYEVDLVQPIDMFPQTFHVESVARAVRR